MSCSGRNERKNHEVRGFQKDALSKGKTVIIIAHRLATIEAADQILVIDNGSVAEKGRHGELVHLGGKYAEFVKIRQAAENWQIAG